MNTATEVCGLPDKSSNAVAAAKHDGLPASAAQKQNRHPCQRVAYRKTDGKK
jgi:hypothetical protein